MWERRVENGAIKLCPLLSFFLMLPLLSQLARLGGGICGLVCVRTEGRRNNLWEVTGGLVILSRWLVPCRLLLA